MADAPHQNTHPLVHHLKFCGVLCSMMVRRNTNNIDCEWSETRHRTWILISYMTWRAAINLTIGSKLCFTGCTSIYTKTKAGVRWSHTKTPATNSSCYRQNFSKKPHVVPVDIKSFVSLSLLRAGDLETSTPGEKAAPPHEFVVGSNLKSSFSHPGKH